MGLAGSQGMPVPQNPAREKALMDSGTTLLHTRKDPNRAASYFARVLMSNPSHYGAQYQMAVALDSAGRVSAAREAWKAFLPMAVRSSDAQSEATARKRLAGADGPLTNSQLMNSAMYMLYTNDDAAGAEALLRELLRRNPQHYGATYQLAVALDREKKPAEARKFWNKILVMAEKVKDKETIATARRRLTRRP